MDPKRGATDEIWMTHAVYSPRNRYAGAGAFDGGGVGRGDGASEPCGRACQAVRNERRMRRERLVREFHNRAVSPPTNPHSQHFWLGATHREVWLALDAPALAFAIVPLCVPRHGAALQLDDPPVPRTNPMPTIALHRHSLHLRGPTASTQPHTATASTQQKESSAAETQTQTNIVSERENRLAAQRGSSLSFLEKRRGRGQKNSVK